MSRFRNNVELFHRLKDIFGAERAKRREGETLLYARSPWTLSLLALRRGDLGDPPDFIVWPETVEEISRLMLLANEWKIPVVPYGGGSSLRGGALPVKGGIICDMKKMNRLLVLDEHSHIVSAQAGILGEILERELARRGYTLGHFPLSMRASTLGGYLATRSAGFMSCRYGKIEDIAVSLQAVLPDGAIVETRTAPRSATGPDFDHLILGCEGTLAIITRARLRVRVAPLSRDYAAYRFTSLSDAADAVRLIFRTGLAPAAVRLTDPAETELTFAKTGHEKSGHLLSLVFDGQDTHSNLESEMCAEICRRSRGHPLGREPAQYWWERRYGEQFRQQPFLGRPGAVMDRIDVAATWSRVVPLYNAMRKALARRASVSAYLAYPDANGAGLTFLWRAETEKGSEEKLYSAVWEQGMKAVFETGGTISHHLGIGLARAAFLPRELGPTFGLLKRMKARLDPNNILNPGKLGMP